MVEAKYKEGSHNIITPISFSFNKPQGMVWMPLVLKSVPGDSQSPSLQGHLPEPQKRYLVESWSGLSSQSHMKQCWTGKTPTTSKVYICIRAWWGHVVARSPSCRQSLEAIARKWSFVQIQNKETNERRGHLWLCEWFHDGSWLELKFDLWGICCLGCGSSKPEKGVALPVRSKQGR